MAGWGFLTREYGNLASVAGLVITLVGFAITWISLRKQRRQTGAAFRAIEALAERLAYVDAAVAATISQELRDALKARKWEKATDRAQMLRNHLGRMIVSRMLEATEKKFLVVARDDAQLLLERAEKLEAVPNSQVPQTLLKKVDRIIAEFAAIDGRLRNAQLEVTDGERTIRESVEPPAAGNEREESPMVRNRR